MRSSAGRSRAGSGGGADGPKAPKGPKAGAPPASAGRLGSAAAERSRRVPSFRPRVGAAARAEDLVQRFRRGDFPATLYLEGPSEPIKALVLAELRHAWARHCPEAPLARVLRAGESSVEEILGAYQATSLFCPRELTVVLEIEDIGRSEKRIEALAAGLGGPPGPSCVVLVESASDSGRKALEPLRAACAAHAAALPPDRSDLLDWGALRLSREAIQAEPGVLETVADACEGDPLAFLSELDKLCTWAGPERVLRMSDATELLRPAIGADLPEYLGAVALGRTGIATRRLGRVLAAGVGEGLVLFALSNLVGGALGGWSRYRDLSEALRRRSSPAKLARALDALYRAEAAWKGGRADVVAVLEQATREVAGSA